MKTLQNRKILFLWIAVLTFAALAELFPMSAKALEDPEIATAAALLVDADTGQILYEKNANERRAPASLTKIMTVMLAIEAYERGDVSLTDIVTVSENAYFDISADGSTSDLKAGEQLTYEELLYCAMIASANEACNVIAEYLDGSSAAFVERMNARALELGCENTHFANAHGMPNDDHYTTASDLMKIVENALDLSLFQEIVSTPTHTVPATNMSEPRTLTSTNKLILSDSVYYYPYASGVKTGYTDAAGYCLVSTATRDNRTLISVVLGGKSVELDDGTTQTQSFSETIRLMEWGFDNFSYQEIISTVNLIREIPVELGKTNTVVLRPAKSVTALLANDVDVTQAVLTLRIYNIENGETLYAPITQGSILGEMSISLNGEDYGTVSLVANTAVELDRMAYMRYKIGETLSNKYVRVAMIAIAAFAVLYIVYIIMYNINRSRRKRRANALARERVERIRREQQADEETTIGKSFEEIESIRGRRT